MGSLPLTNTFVVPVILCLVSPWMDFVLSSGSRLLPGPSFSSTTTSHRNHSPTRTIELTLVPYQARINPKTLIPLHGQLSKNLYTFNMAYEYLMYWRISFSSCAIIYSSSLVTSLLCPW